MGQAQTIMGVIGAWPLAPSKTAEYSAVRMV